VINQARLITYVDRFPGGTLRDLRGLFEGPLKGVFGSGKRGPEQHRFAVRGLVLREGKARAQRGQREQVRLVRALRERREQVRNIPAQGYTAQRTPPAELRTKHSRMQPLKSASTACHWKRVSTGVPKLRGRTSVPLAAGEEWGARWDFYRLVGRPDGSRITS